MDTQDNAMEKPMTGEQQTPATATPATPETAPAANTTAPVSAEKAEETPVTATEPTQQPSSNEQETPADVPAQATPTATEEAPAATDTPTSDAPQTVVEESTAETPAGETAATPQAEPTEENVKEAEKTTPQAQEQEEKPAEVKVVRTYTTKDDVVERVRELAHGDEMPRKDEIETLKATFYKMRVAEKEAERKAFIDGGGNADDFKPKADSSEETFKAEMSLIREKRARLFQEQELQKQENLKTKLGIIEKIKGMATSPDMANKSYQEFKKLQQQWREIKLVPAENASELWHNYQYCVEQYYDQLNLNREAREYDFKKNLEIKTHLCEAAEKLADEEDVVSAFHQLQKLHQEYRETGPVAKDIREEIWTRFKAASTVVNKRHQEHFEKLRAMEEENLAKKTALCEKTEAIVAEENKGTADWDRHTKEIIAIQAEWKTIGFAPQKMNVKIFERFRAACDVFFRHKSEYFKSLREKFAENAEKKRALIAQAQALQDSTDWKATSDKLIALQKEWRIIGMVPRKLGDQLWADFLAACNKFFTARNEATASTRNVERENLKRKREIIAQMEALITDDSADIQEKAQQLSDEYNAVGHVPFRDKDKVYGEYRDVINRLYSERNVSIARRRSDNSFKSSLKNAVEKGADALDNERARLMRRYEGIKQEVQTYENNMGFLNAASKDGNTLIDDMKRKVQKLKDDMNVVREKIKAIDEEAKKAAEEKEGGE